MGNFHSDLQRGKRAEQLIGPFVEKLNGASGLSYTEGKNSDYDFSILLNSKQYTYELKTDDLTKPNHLYVFGETGNGRGGDSGLTATKANKFLFYCPALNIVTSTEPAEIIGLIEDHPNWRRIKCAGDGNSAGVIIPLSALTGSATRTKVQYLDNE